MVSPPLFHVYRAAKRLRQSVRFVIRRPSLGVRGIVVNEAGAVLLVRHTYVAGWFLPGGGVKFKEAPAAALIREMREEAGVVIHETRLIGLFPNFTRLQSDYVALFDCPDWSEADAFRPDFEIAERAFFPLEDLPSATTPATRRRLAEWQGHIDQSSEWGDPDGL
ncbi:MAG: NUDIX domain-containing protein [Pseudomonadota bacterium]